MTNTVEKKADVENEITNLVIELYDAVSTSEKEGEPISVQKYIESYLKRVTRIGFRMGNTEFAALRDSCVIFHQILEDLHKNSTELSPEVYVQFEVWPTLVLSYLANPSDKNNIENLLQFLQFPLWTYHPSEAEFKELKEAFYQVEVTNSLAEIILASEQSEASIDPADNPADNNQFRDELPNTSVQSNDDDSMSAFDGAILESIQQEILEAMSDLLSDLDSMDPDDDFGTSHALSLCADRIELLGMSIATAGLIGLMDVCILFQTGLRFLSNRDEPITNQEREIIEEWPSNLIAYLSSPTDPEVTDALVNYLRNIPWADPMSDEEAFTLKSMLVPEDIEVTAPFDSGSFDEEFAYQPAAEETISSNEEISFDAVAESENENELNFEVDGLVESERTDESEDMYYLGQELVKLIHDEFKLEKASLDDALKGIFANNEPTDKNIEQFNEYKLIIERFSLATESVGLSGLNKTLVHLENNISNIIEKRHSVDANILDYLNLYAELSLNYLDDMDDELSITNLIEPIYSANWFIPIIDNKDALFKELHSPSLLIEDDIEIRATQANSDDVSLALPEDVNQQLLDSLLQELPVQTAAFTDAITQLVEGNATLKEVERAQRIAHTLKGAANTVGVVGIATLTHHIEDIFNAFTKHQRLPGMKLADTLMNAADVLEMMSEALLGQGETPDQALAVLQQILDWANLIDQDGIPDDNVDVQVKLPTADTAKQTEDTTHLKESAAETMLRVPASLMDNLLRIAGESIILGGQLQERLTQTLHQTQLTHQQNLLYQQLVFELEQIVDVQGLTAKKSNTKLNEIFDSLELEQYNELHTVTHRLVEAATDSKELTQNIEDELNRLDTLLVDQNRLHKENQEIVMQTRMVPVQNMVPRLQRGIRQTCRFTGKKVNLNVEGADTLMDSDVLNELIDPMMHILRNAVDHGIEAEKVRKKKHKDETGNIKLSFFRDGDHIVVRCEDDGSGLDLVTIKAIAIKKNLITKDEELSDDELIRLIWLAGFTTRGETTQVSGRGIGMDAVYNQITALKGQLNITTTIDVGCTVEIRLPLTLISVHAILVKLRKQTLAISNRGIEQILSPGDGELIVTNDEYHFHLNDEVFTAYDVETLLHMPRDQRLDDRSERTVLLVRDETGNRTAVTVEQVVGNQDLVVKQLGMYIPDIAGIEGATILGDGSIAPVLDLPGLIRTALNKDMDHIIERLAETETPVKKIIALVVDDSLSARRSLAEFVKDLGYEVRMARDGIEALEVLETTHPDIILADLEMPRMNGLEMTQHIRSNKNTQDIPIIMITSRSTEKHREMADSAGVDSYLTKPFSEDQLLENIRNLLSTAKQV